MSKIYVDAIEPEGVTTDLTLGDVGGADKVIIPGTVKIAGGSPGANKVLTSDAAGDATWAAAADPVSYPSDVWVFRLTTGFNGGNYPMNKAMTKIQYLGSDTFADHSSGVYTFPSTGIWHILFQTSFSNNASYYQWVNIQTTVDFPTGPTWVDASTGYGATRDSNEPAGIAQCQAFFDVENVTTHKCNVGVGANNASMSTLGSATQNNTFIIFQKIGPT